jgi:hypothetical protein
MAARKSLTERDVEFDVVVRGEDMPYEGNCSAIDDDTDREQEQWVRDQLDVGNDLAWCWVQVIARPRDARLARFEGTDSLGGVSCVDQKDLDGVVEAHAMKSEALDDLNRQLEQAREALCGSK